MTDQMEIEAVLSPSQAVRLMCISCMLRDGEISIRGHDPDEAEAAEEAIRDISQEIAIQMAGYDGEEPIQYGSDDGG